MDRKIILASASPRRQELLRQVGLVPDVTPSHVDESGVGGTPEQMVMELSRRKAEDVAAGIRQRMSAADRSPAPDAEAAEESQDGRMPAAAAKTFSKDVSVVVIGADTVVAAGGRILGKPENEEEAAAMIRLLAGRTHYVYTGVTMIFLSAGMKDVSDTRSALHGNSISTDSITFAEGTEVEVYPISDEQIRQYVATGEPMDKAGAYGIQGYFAAYVKGIRGDYNNVVGLPVARVCRELTARGLFWPALPDDSCFHTRGRQ